MYHWHTVWVFLSPISPALSESKNWETSSAILIHWLSRHLMEAFHWQVLKFTRDVSHVDWVETRSCWETEFTMIFLWLRMIQGVYTTPTSKSSALSFACELACELHQLHPTSGARGARDKCLQPLTSEAREPNSTCLNQLPDRIDMRWGSNPLTHADEWPYNHVLAST